MTEEKKAKLSKLIETAISMGDATEELCYWEHIFDTLDEQQKDDLIAIMEKEVACLEKL